MTSVLIKSTKENLLDNWKRLEFLWAQRYEYMQNQAKRDSHKNELATYLLWIPYMPESPEQYKEMIAASVEAANDAYLIELFKYLAKVVDKYPSFVMNIFEQSLRKKDLSYFLIPERQETRTILEIAIRSEERKARESAVRVINFYGEQGYDGYRDLLT